MKKTILTLSSIAAAALMCACGGPKQTAGTPRLMEAAAFDTIVNGRAVSLHTLQNASGMVVQLTNYGARMVSVWVPSADGTSKDVITGFENIAGYIGAVDTSNGPVVGRYGNRIAKGRFTLDGVEYTLPINNGENHLHGGPEGFAQQVWTVTGVSSTAVSMSYTSPDGEAGYPGNLTLNVTYTLGDDNALRIDYEATTDAPTVINPTSHSYFNLHGTTSTSPMTHVMQIFAGEFTPTDSGLIPTGEIASVEGTPLDFRTPTPVGERIDADFEPLRFGGGYDHNWVLDKSGAGGPELAARVWEPATGIVMEVLTDQPGIQFYSGNSMKNGARGKHGDVSAHRGAIALETQHFPDSPNHENFPSTVLRPGETYTQTCIYRFSVMQ